MGTHQYVAVEPHLREHVLEPNASALHARDDVLEQRVGRDSVLGGTYSDPQVSRRKKFASTGISHRRRRL